jgi:hypothetical protein
MSAVPSVPLPSPRAPRAVRSALFAVVCVGVGATLHGVAGGCPATWTGVGLGLLAVWLAAWSGLARERSWPALTVGLGIAQVGLHLLFSGLESGAATAHATAVAAMNPATPNPATPNLSAVTMPDMPGMVMQHPNPYSAALTMITAHALAVVVCGWWLGQGERDFFALCRAVGTLAAAPVHRLTEAVAALVAVARSGACGVPRWYCRFRQDDGPRQRPAPLLTVLTFRGPPVVA